MGKTLLSRSGGNQSSKLCPNLASAYGFSWLEQEVQHPCFVSVENSKSCDQHKHTCCGQCGQPPAEMWQNHT
eukprot:1158145-Pelagomonas_calceolata.AAC.3